MLGLLKSPKLPQGVRRRFVNCHFGVGPICGYRMIWKWDILEMVRKRFKVCVVNVQTIGDRHCDARRFFVREVDRAGIGSRVDPDQVVLACRLLAKKFFDEGGRFFVQFSNVINPLVPKTCGVETRIEFYGEQAAPKSEPARILR